MARISAPREELGAVVQGRHGRQIALPDVHADHLVLLSRLLFRCHAAYRQALAADQAICRYCGRPALIVRERYTMFQTPELLRDCYGAHIQCAACGMHPEASLMHLTLDLPETQRFWRVHPRLQIIPDREIEFAGRSAILTSLRSVTDQARLEVIAARDTFDVLHLQEGAWSAWPPQATLF